MAKSWKPGEEGRKHFNAFFKEATKTEALADMDSTEAILLQSVKNTRNMHSSHRPKRLIQDGVHRGTFDLETK